MNKKTLKPLIITAAVAILLAAAWLILSLIPENEPPEVTPSAAPPREAIYVVNEPDGYYNLLEMRIENIETKETVTVNAFDVEGQRTFEVKDATGGWVHSQDKMRSMAWNAVQISALAVVEESASDMAQYGLDKPAFKIKITFKDGDKTKSYNLEIGAPTAVGDSFYGRLAGEKKVYAVAKYSIQTLSQSELALRELHFFPSYMDEAEGKVVTNGAISYLRLTREKTGMDIELTRRTDKELAGDMPAGTTYHQMTKPVISECNDQLVEEQLIAMAVSLQVQAVVVDAPEDLTEYGFDDPIDIWLKNFDGEEVHYIVGYFDAAGNAYVMVEGIDSVMSASGFVPQLAEQNYVDYLFKLLWIHNITSIKSIRYDMKGTGHLLDIKRNEKDAEGNDVFEAQLDGRSVSETNAKRLFSRTLDMMISSDLDTPFSTAGKTAEYKFTIGMKDGTSHTLELYALNERQFAASVNGDKPQYYINVASVRNLAAAFDTIAKGEEIPR